MDKYDCAIGDLVCASLEVTEESSDKELGLEERFDGFELKGHQNKFTAMDGGNTLAQEYDAPSDTLPLSYFQPHVNRFCNQLH